MTTKLHLSKLDAALRQLETAVTLYFHSSDPISIHTLTAAAYNVLQGIKKHRGAGFQMFKDADMVYPGRLTGERRPVLVAYMSWFCIRHPQYYETQPEVFRRASMLNGQYKETDRSTFFNEALTAGYNPFPRR